MYWIFLACSCIYLLGKYKLRELRIQDVVALVLLNLLLLAWIAMHGGFAHIFDRSSPQ